MVIVLAAGSIGFATARFAGTVPNASGHEQTPPDVVHPPAANVSPVVSLVATDRARQGEGTLGDRLRECIKSRDVFVSARKLAAALESLTIDDLESFVGDPAEFPIPSTYGFDQDFSNSFIDAFVERWLLLDPAGAFAAIKKLEGDLKRRNLAGSADFSAALARVKPELLLDSLPANAKWERFDASITTAFSSLASRDPNAARTYMARISDAELRKAAEVAIASGVAKVDPLGAVDIARSLNDPNVYRAAVTAAERVGPGMLRRVLEANGGKFPTAEIIPNLLLKYPHEDLHEFLDPTAVYSPGISTDALREAGRMTAVDRDALLASLENAPVGARDKVVEAVVFSWAREQPREATEWALAHAKPSDGAAPETVRVGAAFYHWYNNEPAAAQAWFSALPDSPLRARLGNGIATLYAADGRLDEALALYRPLGIPDDSEAAAYLGTVAAERDTVTAAGWLSALPGESGFEKPAAAILRKWLTRDPVAAAQWVEAQPPGPRRDAAFSAYAREAAELDPYAAAEWAVKVSDPKARTTALETVYREMKQQDAPGARAWIRSVPGVDAAWRERLIRY